ncbi:N-acetyltransferase family protein [Kribbella sp. NPDC055071]
MHQLRPATPDDVAFLTEVVIEATRAQGRLSPEFAEPAVQARFAAWHLESIEDPATDVSVIELDGIPVGRLRVSRSPESIELNGIQLLPSAQNQGIGTAIITQLQSEAASTGVPLDLGVEHDNADARRLYNRLGFHQIGKDDKEAKLRWPADPSGRETEVHD